MCEYKYYIQLCISESHRLDHFKHKICQNSKSNNYVHYRVEYARHKVT